jgi:tetratricopeptide (TPR) repeat protein
MMEAGAAPPSMKVYNAKTVAKMLHLSVGQVRSYARAGFLTPERGPRGEYRFSFQDLILLRTAKGLIASRIPPHKVRRTLKSLSEKLPTGRPLSGLRIAAEGDQIVVRDGDSIWDPESGQAHLNFEVASLARRVAPHARKLAAEAFDSGADDMSDDDWHALGTDLESTAPEHAREAYRRALDLNPDHVPTRLNLGRLLHEEGKLHAAEAHYRLALSVRPGDGTALFNLGVCLEDLGRTDEAMVLYRRTIRADADCADAYYNLARLYEKRGDSAAALRHLQTYRRLIETP